MTANNTKWFATWFDTPYYHILYQDRDHTEAKLFMDNLTQYLNLNSNSKILDLACGKGRHSIYLNKIGFQVTGVDLSENSIEHAKAFENERLQFKVHDMTKPYPDKFNAVFNLFTSFGYFDEYDDNLKTIIAIKSSLKESGYGVIDFLNVPVVLDNLVEEDSKTMGGITFNQKRTFKDGYITKTISFTDQGEDFKFQERVRAFTLTDFKTLFDEAGVTLKHTFGNYKLDAYDASKSERLILIFK